MDDLDLRRVLSAAVADEPPLQRSPDDVLAAARRILIVRTTGAWAGAALVAAVLVASVAIVGKTPAGQPDAQAGAGGTAGAATASGKPSSLPPTSGPGPQAPPPLVRGSTMLATLLSLLPPGTPIVSKDGRFDDTARAVLSDSQGRVLLLVGIGTLTDGSLAHEVFTCTTRGLPAGTQCEAWTRPDGTRVIATDGPNEDKNVRKIRQREVDVLTPDGSRITLDQFNSEQDKAGPVSRPALLLTLDEMQTIALNPAWWQRQ